MPTFLAQAQTSGIADIIDSVARTPLSRIVIFVGVLTILRLVVFPYMMRTPPHRRTAGYRFLRFFNDTADAMIYAGILVFLLLRPFAIQLFRIPSGSMVFTLMVNDFILVNKAIYRYTDPKVGDIVVFRPPVEAVEPKDLDQDGQVKVDFVKRCVGTPGQTVEIRNNVLYRNGKPIDEPYKVFTQQFSVSEFKKLTREEINAEIPYDFKLVKYEGKYIPLTISADFVNDTNRTARAYQVMDAQMMHELRSLPAAPIPKGYYLMMGDNRNGSFDSRGWGLVPRKSIVGRAEWVLLPLARFGRP